MAPGFKHRQWQAFLSVSASGPEFSPDFEANGRFFRTRMAADLNYTTADVNFLEQAFRHHDQDRPVQDDLHLRLRNPLIHEFFKELSVAESWLAQYKDNEDWDGGAIQLCFAGHGREVDGAFELQDGVITPEEFTDALVQIAKQISSPARLRLSVILDSCHSGAFVTSMLDACFNRYDEWLVPFNLFAACMHDEFAWEESSLGHGLFTYCMSVSRHSLMSVGASAIQTNNSAGPSLAIAGGEFGCSLLTAGAQNPIGYWNGTGHIEVSRRDIDLFENDERCLTLDEMRKRLVDTRDKLRDILQPLRRDIQFFKEDATDEDMRKSIRDELAFIRSPQNMARMKQFQEA